MKSRSTRWCGPGLRTRKVAVPLAWVTLLASVIGACGLGSGIDLPSSRGGTGAPPGSESSGRTDDGTDPPGWHGDGDGDGDGAWGGGAGGWTNLTWSGGGQSQCDPRRQPSDEKELHGGAGGDDSEPACSP